MGKIYDASFIKTCIIMSIRLTISQFNCLLCKFSEKKLSYLAFLPNEDNEETLHMNRSTGDFGKVGSQYF